MKRYTILALCLVLTAASLVGCGCTNRNMNNTTEPTVLPTNEEVWDTTAPTRATTEATSAPTTMDTNPAQPDGTIDHGNGPLEDTTVPTSATEGTAENRARTVNPNAK